MRASLPEMFEHILVRLYTLFVCFCENLFIPNSVGNAMVQAILITRY